MLGIISAMPEECDSIVSALVNPSHETLGGRRYYSGMLFGKAAVVVFSRWGKVAAATTATQLLIRFGVTAMIFTGVAGAVDRRLRIGDVVVGLRLLQHDLDASPLFPRYEVPLLGRAYLPADRAISKHLVLATREFFSGEFQATISQETRDLFGIAGPAVHEGDIVTGDKFFARSADLDELRQRLPAALCVEMEGAAVAQVCFEHAVNFGIVRVISDSADESAPVDFPKFIAAVASPYCLGIMRRLIGRM